MRELSLHILDIVQNSLRAGATKVEIIIDENTGYDRLEIIITDNGKGLERHRLEQAADPFFTSRDSRKVGLGLALFQAATEQCNGSFSIRFQPGRGTMVTASFQSSHLDRAPLGSMEETMEALVACNPEVDFVYCHRKDGKEFVFDTGPVRDCLEPVKINHPRVLAWLKENIREKEEVLGRES